MEKEREEIRELSHEPEPGYRTIFFIAFTLAVLYLCFIFKGAWE